MKNTLLLPLIVFSMLFTGAFGADVKKPDEKKSAKAKPELVAIELAGKISKAETKGKNDRTYTYYYLETAEGEKVRLTKTALPKAKKDKDGKKAASIKLDEFIGASVKLTGKGYTKELKNKKKRTYVKSINTITKT